MRINAGRRTSIVLNKIAEINEENIIFMEIDDKNKLKALYCDIQHITHAEANSSNTCRERINPDH